MTQPTHSSEVTDIYPEATEGRVKTSNAPSPSPPKDTKNPAKTKPNHQISDILIS